jgi:hypothetical protein
MQHACTIVSGFLWLHNIFRHYLINCTIFGRTLLNIKCVFWFSIQLLFEISLVMRRIERYIVIHVKTSSCRLRVILVEFWWNFKFLNRFSKIAQMSNSNKILTVGAEFLRAGSRRGRRTHRRDDSFRNFANAPENGFFYEKHTLMSVIVRTQTEHEHTYGWLASAVRWKP